MLTTRNRRRAVAYRRSSRQDWFQRTHGLPDRAGYYLGYLFAKSVGDGVPLPKLARMSLPQVHERERAFLTRLAQP